MDRGVAVRPVADAARAVSPLTRKLRQGLALSREEAAVAEDLLSQRRSVRANTDIVVDGDEYGAILIVCEGWAYRYKLLADGRRQILNFVLPGDGIGSYASLFTIAANSVQSLTDVVLGVIAPDRLHHINRHHPRLSGALSRSLAQGESMLAEHVVRIGRRTAYERMAHLLMELLMRLQAVGFADHRSYDLPLTQEILADALGLSIVHVNRTLRQLRRDGLLRIEGRRIVIDDVDRLTEVAEFEPGYLEQGREARSGDGGVLASVFA
ncbi:MAG: Crp/Fnr family transcriptional regulator [Alphaproteobacteria bacterium]